MLPVSDSVELQNLDLLVVEYRGKESLITGSVFCIDFLFRGVLSKFINENNGDDDDFLVILDKGMGVKNILLINNKKGIKEKFAEKFENRLRKLNLSTVGVVFFDLSCNNINNKNREIIKEISYRNRCEIFLYPEGKSIKMLN